MSFFEKSLELNIKKIYILKVIRWFLIVIPIMVPFYQKIGINMTQFMLLQSIFSFSMLAFDVPAGYFADNFGRVKTLLFSSILSFIGFTFYCFSYHFWQFILVQIILGISTALSSGTDSALIYDTLLELDKTDDYRKIEAKGISLESFSEATASIIGGFTALISLRFNFYIETIIIFFSIPLALTLKEPTKHLVSKRTTVFESLNILKDIYKKNESIKWIVWYSSVISASTLMLAWFIQPYFQLVGVPLAFFGIIWALLNYSVSIFSLFSNRLEKILGEKNSLISFIALITFSYLALSIIDNKWGILFLFLVYFVRGFNAPIFRNYINDAVTSNVRATVMSLSSFGCRIIFSILAPIIGFIIDNFNLSLAILIAGITHFILAIIPLFFLIKNAGNKFKITHLS